MNRLLFIKICLLTAFAAALGSLVKIQIIDAAKYQAIARKQYEAKVILPATRGNIYDCNGNVLASNSMFVSYAADPKIIGENTEKVARAFSRFFGKPEAIYLQKLHSVKRFVWLERHIAPNVARSFDIRKLTGVVTLDEPKRLYHYDETGGQVVGCTNTDNVGISGAEFTFDKQLRGKDGYVVMQRDGLGRTRPSTDFPREEPVNGHSIVLTLDIGYQSIVEDELKKGAERAKADAGIAIMLDPNTGAVLAMAHYPSVNPNTLSNISMEALKVRAVTDMVEPGSVFKLVTASAALGNNLVKPDQMFFAENGTYRVPLNGGRVRVIRDTHENGMITFAQALELSSNIVFAKVGNIIGAERLYTEARNFGFGMMTGIELPGEVSGDLKKPVEWSGATLNSMAFGYEVGVTPLQIVTAYAALANGGTLMKPYIFSKEIDEEGNIVAIEEPERIRRVISPETDQVLKNLFLGVVEHGTGQSARVPGISIAGKTGTSRKYEDGKYEAGNYNASFVGFLPVENPTIVLLVMIENPKNGYTGAMASAPIFKAVAERIMNNNGLFSKDKIAGNRGDEDTLLVTVPNVCNVKATTAVQLLDDNGFHVSITGTGDVVVRQLPAPGTKIHYSDIVQVMTNLPAGEAGVAPDSHGSNQVPDLKGMTIRRAINSLMTDKLNVEVLGSGIVISQSPIAGTLVSPGMKVTVVCEPRAITTAQLY
ncbi:MAG: penicillin-binding protein [Bacteroidota bacterium]|nr:penicillin-binding protein [Bacteroidota bacterium]